MGKVTKHMPRIITLVKKVIAKHAVFLSSTLLSALVVGCATQDITVLKPTEGSEEQADMLLIVDCLLPGQIKRLGTGMTYVTPRRPAKLTAQDCQKRGGEYVAYDQANSATALKVWLPTAQEGDPVAQTYVGEIYEKGMGIQPDYKLAAAWYKKAADQGHARAKLDLGYLFEKGLGVKKDLTKALQLYREASGFVDTDIEFESSIDPATTSRDAQQLKELKTSLEEEKQKVETVRKQMEQTQQQLDSERSQLEDQNIALERERKRLEKQKQAATLDAKKKAKLEAQLQKRETELERRRQETMQLKATLEDYRKEAQKDRPLVAIAGPSIQLVNPPIVTVRGIQEIAVRPETKTREIIGRIAAPAGLNLVSVNDDKQKIDEKGIFRALLPLKENRTPVRILAVDAQGKRAEVEFSFVHEAHETKPQTSPAPASASVSKEMGHYYALVIGNNKYTQFPELKTPVTDAKAVADVLSSKYGFKTTTLVNANRFMILATLNRLSKKLTDKDNLLIFYAGHGELAENKELGYWLPVDADRDNKRKWIPNSAVSDILSAMPVKRVLVIADSCYSGALTRSSLAQIDSKVSDAERLTWLRTMAKSRARLALTSGGLQPVPDTGGGVHSLFAKALLDVLEANSGILEGQRLYQQLAAHVSVESEAMVVSQTPQYAPIRHSGHESGEFFFLPKRTG